MPRGGKRKDSGAPERNSNASGSKGGGKRKHGGAPERNSNSKGKGAPARNLNALRNQGGARLGNSNSSSRAKKISTLFAMGVELDIHGEFLKALDIYSCDLLHLVPRKKSNVLSVL